MNAEALFHAALALNDAQRAAFLEEACAGNAGLRARVEALLAAHAGEDSLLDAPAASPPEATGDFVAAPLERPATSDYQPTAAPGIVIAGRYVLEQLLGAGGMGEVWVARQTEPVKRRVALKLIKAGMDSRAVLQRFEAERQALALMDHPHIAKVLDGGITPQGHPFFVMELVNGLSVTRFCDENKLTPQQRLALFVPICHAVQHAHQKGIVHRDLKPSNILVTLIDGTPVPKVIDFGVAKATGGKLTDESLFTQFGAVVGTLEYMAPEQAGYSGQDIDTRADIYSLGVLLYELLTGLRPLDGKRLRDAALSEMIRILREVEPSKPSTRLSTNEALPSLAASRHMEPKKLMALLRGDLDWIVMKCLEKDRNRRYDTANQLGLEIQRYLADEPVQAGPPGAGYRLRKFVKRNQGPVLAATLIVLCLLGGIIGTSVGLIWAMQEKADALRERDEKDLARKDAEANAERARQAADRERAERKQSDAVVALLESVFRGLDPGAGKKGDASLRAQLTAQLDLAAANLEHEYAGQPLVRARMRQMLGLTQMGMGNSTKAEALFQGAYEERARLLGPTALETLAAQNNLAVAQQNGGKLKKAVELLTDLVNKATQAWGEDSEPVFAAWANLGGVYVEQQQFDKAIEVLERVRRHHKKMPATDLVAETHALNNLAAAYQSAGRVTEAIPILEELRRRFAEHFPPDHPAAWAVRHNLATAYQRAGRSTEAIELLNQVLEWQQNKLGPGHPDLFTTRNGLAAAYSSTGRAGEACKVLAVLRAQMIEKFGLNHPQTAVVSNNLGGAYLVAGHFEDAIAILEPLCIQLKQDLTESHSTTLIAMNTLGRAYSGMARHDDAVRQFETVLRGRSAVFGPDAPATLATRYYLGMAYYQAGQFDKAEATARDLLRRTRKGQTEHIGAQSVLGLTLLKTGRAVEAESIFRERLAAGEQKEAGDWTTFYAKSLVGAALFGQKKYVEAEALLLAGYQGLKQREAQIDSEGKWCLTDALQRLEQLYEATGKPEEAAKWRKELEAHQAAQKQPVKQP